MSVQKLFAKRFRIEPCALRPIITYLTHIFLSQICKQKLLTGAERNAHLCLLSGGVNKKSDIWVKEHRLTLPQGEIGVYLFA